MERNEVHLCDFPNGHVLSIDCWCEPTRYYWVTNKHGINVLVVEHVDDTPSHHMDVLNERESRKRKRSLVNNPDATWITRVLEKVGKPPLLPPPGETK